MGKRPYRSVGLDLYRDQSGLFLILCIYKMDSFICIRVQKDW